MYVDVNTFLASYPMSISEQRVIDLANNNKPAQLLGVLSGYLKGIYTLRSQQTPCRAKSSSALATYYAGKIRAMISLVADKSLQSSLHNIYVGDE